MNVPTAEQYIRDHVRVSPPLVAAAKSYIVDRIRTVHRSATPPRTLVHDFLQHMGADPQTQVVLHPTVDPDPSLRAAVWRLTCQLAAIEAVWSLIATGALLPTYQSSAYFESARVPWTTVVPGSGGHSSSWDFPEFAMPLPATVSLAPSLLLSPDTLFTDADLYLRTLDIPTLHPLVEESLREAVRCFRAELYMPTLVMLTKAIEGVWTEVGTALADVLEPRSRRHADRLRNDLLNPHYNLAKRIVDVREVYKRKDLLEDVWKESGVTAEEVQEAALWSDTVRDSRNVVHYNPHEQFPVTFESVATILLSTTRHLRSLYRVHDAAHAVAART
jgi:hypothetical protein